MVMMIGYQNCAKAPTSQENNPFVEQEKVIGTTSQFHKVVFDPALELGSLQKSADSKRVEIDVSGGALKIISGPSSQVSQCSVDVDRLQQLKSLLSISQVCEPGPLPEGTAVCMAYAMADVELANEDESVKLRSNMCHSGTFLCDGNDKKLRELLSDLRDNPPASCQ